MANFDCAKQKTIFKTKRPERPECEHGPMRSSGRRWRCSDFHQKEKKLRRGSTSAVAAKARNRKTYRGTQKGRMSLRNERMNRQVKNRQERIEANQEALEALITSLQNVSDSTASSKASKLPDTGGN